MDDLRQSRDTPTARPVDDLPSPVNLSRESIVEVSTLKKGAISPSRRENYAEWYLKVIEAADLAEHSDVRGCMIIKPWGYGIWRNIQRLYDRFLDAADVKNAYFPMFIPMSYFQKEAAHAEGFAKEVAVVTHRRLAVDSSGKLVPSSPLEEPLVVRPTSEMVIGAAFARWVSSYRDLPLKVNQWCNVVRMEMRTRPFLRTVEFLWQEGHSVHASYGDAEEHAQHMLEDYEIFARSLLAIPVIAGEKIASERFAGADNTLTIEAMMQDGKALQAATSHNLGQNFATACGIQFQNRDGQIEQAHTASWGMSTRLIGALIMSHGDDDGLRLPPHVAPTQIVVLPVISRKGPTDEIYSHAGIIRKLCSESSFGEERLRVEVDKRDMRGGDKNWEWIKKGVPIRVEIGQRELGSGTVTIMRRDRNRLERISMKTAEFIEKAPHILGEIHDSYLAEAERRMLTNTRTDIRSLEELREYFGVPGQRPDSDIVGFASVPLHDTPEVLQALDELAVTVRCTPFGKSQEIKRCIITGRPGASEMIVARSY